MRLACRYVGLAVIFLSGAGWCWAQFPGFPAGTAPAATGTATGVAWQTDLPAAQRVAGPAGKLVLVHFWAPWCRPCMKLEEQVFSRPEVGQSLNANFVCVKINADQAPEMAKMYNVTSLPTDVILTAQGNLITQLRCPQEVDQYLQQVTQVAEGYRKFTGQVAAQATQGAGLVQDYIRGTETQVHNALAGVSPPQAATPQVPFNPQGPPGVATDPPTASSPTPNLPGTPASSQGPTLPNYSDDRYADYFRNRQPETVAANAAATPAVPPMASAAIPPQAGIPPQSPIPPQVPTAATAAAALSSTASTIQLPEGSPPLGLDGYCPVILKEQKRWVTGDRRWGAIHRGRTYLFTGPEEQKKFLESPDAFAPVISGNDPVLALDGGQVVTGRREHGVFYENRIYLFADEASLQRFYQNPSRYAAEVVQAMR